MDKIDLGPRSWLFPMPVLLIGTFSKENKPNLMACAWGSIYDTNQIYICLSSNHKTSKNILFTDSFTISIPTQEDMEIADYVGNISGNDEDKIAKLKLEYEKSKLINAPIFNRFLLTLECKVNKLEDDDETMYVIGDIVNIKVDSSIINESKIIDLNKFKPLVYEPSSHSYLTTTLPIGKAYEIYKKIKIIT